MGSRIRLGVAAAGCVALACSPLMAGCDAATSTHPAATSTHPASTSTHPASTAPTAAASGARTPVAAVKSPGGVRKILVIMEENHSMQQVFPSGMPYLWSLARQYGHATQWTDVGHPSLPNYLAIFAGSAFNNPQDCPPGPGCTYPGPTVFGQALALGKTAKAYEESMPGNCDRGFSGEYDVNHNPWAYFPDEAASCMAMDVPAGTPTAGPLASDVRDGSLPAVGLVTPNLRHDGHDGTLAQADAWLKHWIPVLKSGPDWRDGKLAIVVVFDEGETTEQVPFVLMAPRVPRGTMTDPANQYALTRLIDKIVGARPLRQAATSANVAAHFGLSR